MYRHSPTRWFLLCLCGYLLLHGAIRAALPYSLEYDEAEQLLHVQTAAWGYDAQPPLYSWIFAAFVAAFGVNVVAVAAMRFMLLGVVYLLVYRLSRKLGLDPLRAVAAACAPMLLTVFAWESVRMMTHTILLCAVCLLTLLAVLRLRDRPALTSYLALGVCLGAGGLAKYNFAVFAAGLLAVAVWEPTLRRRILDARLTLAVVVAALMVLPHGLWLHAHREEVAAYVRFQGFQLPRAGGSSSAVVRFASMLGQHLAALVPLACCLALWRGRREGESTPDDAFRRRFLARLLLCTAPALAVAMAAGGVTHLRLHWVAPWLLLLAPAFLCAVGAVNVPAWRVRAYFAATAASAAVMVAVRAATLFAGPEPGMCQTRDLLHHDLSLKLLRDDTIPARILAPDPVQAGYQRLYFPHAEVVCLGYGPAKLPQKPINGPTLALWADKGEGWRAVWLETFLAGVPESAVNVTDCPPGVRPRGSVRQLRHVVLPPPAPRGG